MTRSLLTPFLALALAQSGCKDTKEASKANFAAALNSEFSNQHRTVHLDTVGFFSEFPTTFIEPTSPEFDPYYDKLSRLVSVGLLERDSEPRKSEIHSKLSGKDVTVKEYRLTTTGKKHFRQVQHNNKRLGALTYGTPKVKEILSFTEPTAAMGVTVSHVSFTYFIDDIPLWATKPTICDQFPEIARDVASRQHPWEDRKTFVLRNDGWVTEESFKR